MSTDVADGPIHACIERWHAHLRGELPGGLDALLHDDCVFFSPIVFTPQRGREITKLYLRAAGGTLAVGTELSDPADPDAPATATGTDTGSGGFRYVTEIREGHHAMLEFETEIDVDGDPKYANGVDIITCDDDGMIVEFKVMMRPLQAINAIHAQMKAMLEQLAGD